MARTQLPRVTAILRATALLCDSHTGFGLPGHGIAGCRTIGPRNFPVVSVRAHHSSVRARPFLPSAARWRRGHPRPAVPPPSPCLVLLASRGPGWAERTGRVGGYAISQELPRIISAGWLCGLLGWGGARRGHATEGRLIRSPAARPRPPRRAPARPPHRPPFASHGARTLNSRSADR